MTPIVAACIVAVLSLTATASAAPIDQANVLSREESSAFDVEQGGVDAPDGAWAIQVASPVAGVSISESSTLLMFGLGLLTLVRRRRNRTVSPN